ncbi:MAG TPA: ParB/RepB/Spo0J family partition protein [Candidatus Avoscillospira avicola]|uniref:ParB/RepB/Spo0J family partition protein n=1 Tax=Candidatus Avoscillospira avicola TaxID=2840706 RepID=A0A9D1AQY8_9FIRM|nr:ParB/RepB/Spo0J family partition protein [Candidatus Avoscillospira avicola]
MAGKISKGLGRGLDALLGDAAQAEPVTSLPVQKLEPNPLQPRKLFEEAELQDLADSISQHGVIQPLTVRAGENGYYQIIAGERRWRAARLAGLRTVPVVVIEADDKTAMELALIENLQRQDLNPMEEAMGYKQLMEEYGMTQEQVAERVAKSRPAVANSLRLLSLPPSIAQMVTSGAISAGHGRALLTLESESLQEKAAGKIVALSLSVRQAETMCKNMAKAAEKEAKPEKPPLEVDYVAECEKTLSKALGRGVKIVRGRRKGRFELEFYGDEDLQRLYEALQKIGL